MSDSDGAPEHPHLIDGEFQSDKYPTTPRGKVPLSCKDPTAQDLLWLYAQRRRAVDAEFATDLELSLTKQGFDPRVTVELTARIRSLEMLVQHMAVGHMHNVEKLDAARDRLSEELKRRPTAAAAGNAAEVLRRTQRAVETASGQGDPILMQRLSKEGIAEALQALGAVCGGFVEDAAASQSADVVERAAKAIYETLYPGRSYEHLARTRSADDIRRAARAALSALPPRDDLAERLVEAVRMVMSSSRTDFDVRCTIANLVYGLDAARRAAR